MTDADTARELNEGQAATETVVSDVHGPDVPQRHKTLQDDCASLVVTSTGRAAYTSSMPAPKDQRGAPRMRAARLALGLTQEQLGELCGVTHSTIQRVEAGKRDPSKSLMELIAHHLRSHPCDLFFEPMPAASEEDRAVLAVASQLGAEDLGTWMEMGKVLVGRSGTRERVRRTGS